MEECEMSPEQAEVMATYIAIAVANGEEVTADMIKRAYNEWQRSIHE